MVNASCQGVGSNGGVKSGKPVAKRTAVRPLSRVGSRGGKSGWTSRHARTGRQSR